ncbi:MAG TPA: SDR family oxidoreductase [Candidatus Dormibacteraeota bacterium]|nr:SDR family oxidoreductase [Candidatus Dormibacteraeota bacterium]
MNTTERRHILVTGGAGYIGSTLTELLLSRGYEVTVLDRFYFGNTLTDLEKQPSLHLVKGDIRSVGPSVFKGVYGVCDLAALSNDPAGELDPEKTFEINHRGRARVCRLAKEAGVRRYVLASSCSIYGYQGKVVDETSPINPLTTYAEANKLAEKSALDEGTDEFIVGALRQATVYGISRRMRFDLAVNGMTLALFKQGSVRIMRDGKQWRPMIHIRDTSRAFLTMLESESEKVNGQVFNVGSEEQNMQVLPLAKRLSEAVGIPFREDWYGDPDNRSYKVSFRKIRDRLGYSTELKPEDGAREIFSALKTGRLKDTTETRTVEWYKALLASDKNALESR